MMTAFASTPDAARVPVRPWVRYWARMADYVVYGAVLSMSLAVVAPRLLQDPRTDDAMAFVFIALYVFIEPLCLTLFGTTPGRSLLRVRLERADGQLMTYREMLARSAKVWWRGLAIGFPLIGLFTLIAAHSALKRDGITSWDREGGFIVRHEPIGTLRTLATLALFASMMFLSALGGMLP